MREICTSGSMRGRRKRTALYRACVLLYRAPIKQRLHSLVLVPEPRLQRLDPFRSVSCNNVYGPHS